MSLSDTPKCGNAFLCAKPRVQQIAVTETLSGYLPHQRYVLRHCQAKQRIMLLRALTIRSKKCSLGSPWQGPLGGNQIQSKQEGPVPRVG